MCIRDSLFTGKTLTMSVAIYQEVIRVSYGTAAALATILTDVYKRQGGIQSPDLHGAQGRG